MVTVLREAGMRFVIYTDDHEPAHTHVYGDGETASIYPRSHRDIKPGNEEAGFERSPCHCSGEQAPVHRKVGEHPWVKLSLKIVTTEKLP